MTFGVKHSYSDWMDLFERETIRTRPNGSILAENNRNRTDSDCFSRKWTQTWLIWTVSRENGSKLDWFGLFLAKTDPNLIDLDCFSRKRTRTWLIWTVSREKGPKLDWFGLFLAKNRFKKIKKQQETDKVQQITIWLWSSLLFIILVNSYLFTIQNK